MTSGSRLPIVLLPGLDGTGRFQEELAALLRETQPVQAISYPADRKLAYPDLTEFVIERLPEGQFVILGESFSGPVAVEIAARLPGRAAALILAATFVRSPFPVGDHFAHAWLSMNLPRLRWVIAAGLFGRFGSPAHMQILKQALVETPRSTFAFRIGEIMRVNKRARLADVRCPILYMRGRRDLVVRAGSMRLVLDAAPCTTLAQIDGPHAFLTTHAKASATAIEAFIASLSCQ